MLKNYFIISWRNLIRDKSYSSFNIIGLAVGMGVGLLIGLWVLYHLSYDKWVPQSDLAYKVMMRNISNGETGAGVAIPLPTADMIKKDIPEIKYVAQADWMGQHSLMVEEKKLYIAGAFAGEDFLKIFPFRLLKGNVDQVLHEPASIVLNESTATALFGTEDPINQTVKIDNLHDVKVTGIVADLPGNSSFGFNYIMPFSFYIQTQDWIRENLNNWNLDPIQTFVALQPGATRAQVDTKLKAILKTYDARDYKNLRSELFLYPFRDWHLYSDFENGVEGGGFVDYVRMFGLIGIIVLIIACINFVNLATARSERRAREVGVRKAIGSQRKDILQQFLVEAFVITSVSFVLALFLVNMALPEFNALTDSHIRIPWANPVFWSFMCAYVVLTSLLAGSRPALYLSGLRPVKVLKGGSKEGRASSLPRKVLVVIQFTASIALIISTVIIYRQIQYAKNRPRGFDGGQLVITDGSSDLDHNYAALKNELLQTHLVSSVTKSTSPATDLNSWTGITSWEGKYAGETLGVATVGITDDYFSTLGMKLASGREFDKGIKLDTTDVILNEAAVKRLRFKEPLNQVITWNGNKKIRVIGVVRDALMQSPFASAEPTFFTFNLEWSSAIMYRLAPGVNAPSALAKIGPIFDHYNPAYPFAYHFADQVFNDKFQDEMLIGTLSGIFASLAIFISCLGLFGLAAYTAQQRTREIGIRKVLGATVGQIVVMISREFVYLILISCVVASPLAFYFMGKWLKGYYYRITISADVFLYSAAAALAVTLFTISFQAIRAARQNPVNSLRNE